MTIQEANKIIAEYMGLYETAIYYIDEDRYSMGNSREYTIQKCENYKRQGINCEIRESVSEVFYSESLDALIPVWEKLSDYYGINFWKDAGKYDCRIDHVKQLGYTISNRHKTPQ